MVHTLDFVDDFKFHKIGKNPVRAGLLRSKHV